MGAKCCCAAGCLKLDYNTKFEDALKKIADQKGLKGLCLTFSGKKIESDVFKFFNDVFTAAKDITCLRLDVQKSQLDENDAKLITGALANLTQLRSVFIDLRNNQLKQAGAQTIRDALFQFKELKKAVVLLEGNGLDAADEKKFKDDFDAVSKQEISEEKKDFQLRIDQGKQLARNIFEWTNEYRKQQGLNELEWVDEAANVSFTYAKDLAFRKQKFLYKKLNEDPTIHSSWDSRCQVLKVSNEKARENIGMKLKLENGSSLCMFQGWQQYQKNNENLLFSEGKSTGVACFIFDEDDDDTWFDDVKDAVRLAKKKIQGICQKKKSKEERRLEYYFVQIIYA